MAPQKENCAGDGDTLRCSFCGLQQDHVRQLIHGPDHLYICDVCTVTAFETICRKDYRTAWLAFRIVATIIRTLRLPFERHATPTPAGQKKASRAAGLPDNLNWKAGVSRPGALRRRRTGFDS
jgi:hypothetical protein